MWTQLPGEKRIALDDENLQYTGRIDFADPQNPVFLFTASFVRFRMTGQHLRVVLTNTHHLWENRLGVVINGEQFGVLLDWDALNVIDLSDHLRDGGERRGALQAAGQLLQDDAPRAADWRKRDAPAAARAPESAH